MLSYNTNDIKSSQIKLFQPFHIFKILPISAVFKMKIYLNLLQQQEKNWNLISSFLVTLAAAISWCCKKPNRSGAEKEEKTVILNPNLKYSLYIFKITFYCFTATENPSKTLIEEIKIKIYSS